MPRLLRALAVLAVLLASTCTRPQATQPPPSTHATAPSAEPLVPELAAAVARLDSDLRDERKRVGTPGAALVIVKEGRVIHAAGYGTRGGGSDEPVDANTVFAIGSTTKAFTSMLVMMAVEAGKLKLSDSPKTCLPSFTLADPAADSEITVQDLLSHRSGLGRTDMAWYAGRLSRAELLQVAAAAQPVAPLGTQYHYQNLMFVAAGECAARVLGRTYEDSVRELIFEPLGMQQASLTHAGGRAAANFAHGHARVGEDERVVSVPFKNIDAVGPAGSINASVNTMAPWLRLLLGKGTVDDTQLVSEDSFDRMISPHTTIAAGASYGLGWVLDTWRGERRVWHNGGIDGYYALVSMLPDQDIGFVLLTSDDSAKLESFVTERVFALAVPAQSQAQPADAARFAGTYGIIGGFQAVVATDPQSKTTTLTVPAQPAYPLLADQGDRFKLGAPAPNGFFARFGEVNGKPGVTIEQPFGPLPLPLLTPEALAAADKAEVPKARLPLLGTYHDDKLGVSVRLVASQGRVALVAAGQVEAPLVERGKDEYGLDGLPNEFTVTVVRDGRGRVQGLELAQPQGGLSLVRVPDSGPIAMTPAALLAKVAKAHGSAAMAEHRTLEVVSRLQFVNQGVEGVATTRHAAPARFAEELRLSAIGKDLGTIWVGHDGERTWERSTFSTVEDVGTLQAEALRLQAAFSPWADPMAAFESVEIVGVDVLPGASEPAVVVRRTTASGIEWTDAIGRESFRLLQRTTVTPATARGPASVETQRFGDYKTIGGVLVPHVVESTTHNGTIVSTVQSVRFDGTIPPDAFTPSAPGSAPPTP